MKKHPLLEVIKSSGLEKLKSGNPWLKAQDLQESWKLEPSTLAVHLGEHWFLYDANSVLRLRRIGPSARYWNFQLNDLKPKAIEDKTEFYLLFADFLALHLAKLFIQKKALVCGDECFRWIFADSDLLPGLIIDVYKNEIVLELSHPVWNFILDQLETLVLKIFKETTGTQGRISIVGKEIFHENILLNWNGLKWFRRSENQHKTGFYLDQRVNHQRAAFWANALGTKTAWDLFSYVGGFSLHLAKNNTEVLSVDASEDALETLVLNAKENGINAKIRTQKADIFKWLKESEDKGLKSDFISLDPPSICPKFKDRPSALRALKELHLRSILCLNSGGLLLSCVCSHHLSHKDILENLKSAAHDARLELRVLEFLSQSPDHGHLIGLPETQYLSGVIVQVF